MRIYKWERLKDAAAYIIGSLHGTFLPTGAGTYGLFQQIEQHMTGQPVKNWRDNAKEMIKKAQAICDNWDIRMAGKLLELFPDIIAKKYRGRSFTCDMDERGNWCLCFE